MEPSRIEDLFQHVILGPLQAHRRGWCFAVQRIDVPRDTTVTSLWELSPDGTSTRLVDDAASPAWDTEARQMAYLGTPPGGGSEVFLFDADTRDTRQLTALEGSIRGIQQFDGERQRLLVLYSETLQDDPQARYAWTTFR